MLCSPYRAALPCSTTRAVCPKANSSEVTRAVGVCNPGCQGGAIAPPRGGLAGRESEVGKRGVGRQNVRRGMPTLMTTVIVGASVARETVGGRQKSSSWLT